MSDSKSTPDWSKDWQALQRQYWNAWSDLTRGQAGSAPDPATPWHEGLEQWSRMFGTAGKQSEAAERLMASARNYLGLMQSMLSFAAGKNALADGGAASSWLDALRGGMNVPGISMPGFDPSQFTNVPGFDAALLNNPVAKAVRDISGQGVRSFEQLAEGAAPWLKQLQSEGMSWLHAPAFGYMREHQEHYQKMALAFAEFQAAVQRYNELMLKASKRSFEILEGKIAEHAEPGRQIESMRALYDLWVDAAEEAYAEVTLSEEFRKVYGDVVNAQMRVRSHLQKEVERVGTDLGMPTRTEMNSVHQRLHDLRREVRNGRGKAGKGDSRRDTEVTALRAAVAELKRLRENSAAPAPARAPAAASAAAAARAKAAPRPRRVAAKRAAPAGAAPTKRSARRPRANAAAKRAVRAPAAKAPNATRSGKVDAAAGAPSFGDAIAAMRQQLPTAPGPKKARAARVSPPQRTGGGNRKPKTR